MIVLLEYAARRDQYNRKTSRGITDCKCTWIVARGRSIHSGGESILKRVLVVEDEQDVAELVEDVLLLEGHEVLLASGETALDRALIFGPDVVLLDLMMPVVDGFEVARRLQGNERTASLPIIVMTAMHDAAARAAEIGTKHYLAKPFDIDVLVSIVEGATGSTASTRGQI